MVGAEPLTGRDTELGIIRRALSGVGNHSGVVIAGAAGVGRTWLAHQALRHAAAAGGPTKWVVDTGPVSAGDSQYPYVGKLVHELTLAQIHTLDCGRLLAEFPRAEVVRGNKIATLPEVFALTDSYRADVRYNIETKAEADQPSRSAEPQQFVDVILAAVRAAGKVSSVEIQSFDWRTVPMVHQAEASIPLVALYNEETWVPGSPWLAGVDAAAVGDPMTGALMVGANIVSPRYQLVSGKQYVDHAHALGLKVIPWTVNDTGAMRDQIGYGVDGIITDYPTLLRGVMADLGMPLPPAYRRG
jgi:glycerophosphoryl diester phosphodiesterase